MGKETINFTDIIEKLQNGEDVMKEISQNLYYKAAERALEIKEFNFPKEKFIEKHYDENNSISYIVRDEKDDKYFVKIAERDNIIFKCKRKM